MKYEAAIWGELCNLRNVLVVLFSLNADLAFTNQITAWEGNVLSTMCIDYVTNMIPITDNLLDQKCSLFSCIVWEETTTQKINPRYGRRSYNNYYINSCFKVKSVGTRAKKINEKKHLFWV